MSNDVNLESSKNTKDVNTRIVDPKMPRIAQVRFKIPTREQMLKESAGEVTRVVNLNTNKPLEDTEGTCFCPKIFGMDADSCRSLSENIVNEEMRKRESNVGHIKLPIPVVQVGTYEKYYLQKLFTNDVKIFTDVIEWKAFVVRPIDDGDRVKRIYTLYKFLKNNEKNLEPLTKSNSRYLKRVVLNNSWRYNPSLNIYDLPDTNETMVVLSDAPKDTLVSLIKEDGSTENVGHAVRLPRDKDSTLSVVNTYCGIDKTITIQANQAKIKARIELSTLNEPESVLILKSDIMNSNNHLKGVSNWGNFEEWKANFQVLPGSYAILDLLTDINLDREIKYLKARIDHTQYELNKKCLEEEMEYDGTKESFSSVPAKIKSGIKSSKVLIDKYAKQLSLLIALKKQGCEPYELVTDIIPVIPIEYRDRTAITTGQGQVSYRVDKINEFYNKMVSFKDRLSQHNYTLDILDLIKYKSDPNPITRQEVINKIKLAPLTNPEVISNMRAVQSTLHEYLVSSSADGKKDFKSLAVRIGSKTGKARADAQGKRIDDSGRGVITPDKTLEIDEIGIPYDILKVHFRNEILKKVIAKQNGIGQFSKDTILHVIDTMGDKFTNVVKVNDEVVSLPTPIVNFISINTVQTKTSDDKYSGLQELIISTLREILKTKRYLAIRFPSLHHLNSLGYKVRIVFSQTIHLNPLVCAGYNADFDGDNMSVFKLSLPESVREVDEIISPIKNDMAADGRPLMTPTQDMIMGLYLLTLKRKDYASQPVKAKFASYDEMVSAYDAGLVDLEDKVQVMMNPYTDSIFARDYKRYIINKAVTKGVPSEMTLEDITDKDTNVESIINNRVIFDKSYENANYGISQYLTFTETEQGHICTLDLTPPVETECSLPVFEQLDNPTVQKGLVESTVGRFIFNSLIPQDLGFKDREKDKYGLEWDEDDIAVTGKIINGKIITRIFKMYSSDVSCYVRDLFKEKGYHFVTLSGISLSLEDIKTSKCRDDIVEETYEKIEELKQTLDGQALTDASIKAWEDATQRIKKESMNELDDLNPLKMMTVSGARGKDTQVAQMIGIRGIMMDANNKKIATPILENFSEGLTPISYITSSYGSCKGIIDRSNKTAETGDLARHLIFGNSSVIITDGDCGDNTGTIIKCYPKYSTYKVSLSKIKKKYLKEDLKNSKDVVVVPKNTYIDPNDVELMSKLSDLMKDGYDKEVNVSDIINVSSNVRGRTPAKDIIDKRTGKILFHKNIPILETPENEHKLKLLDEQYNGEGVAIRSIQTCKSGTKGYCARCYGYLYPKHRYARIGDSVGTFAAHSLSEPGTQLTMRTFHTGGVADGDTSAGFEQYKKTILNVATDLIDRDEYDIMARMELHKEIPRVKALTSELKTFLAQNAKSNLTETLKSIEYPDTFTMEHFGVVHLDVMQDMFDTFYKCIRDPMIANGLDGILSINFEITARQATSNMVIVDSGESIYSVGEVIKIKDLIRENLALLFDNKEPILAIPTVNGFKSTIPDKSEPIKSIIFQNVVERITNATMLGAVDDLTNPMSALCLGNVMPLGEDIKYYEDKLAPKEDVQSVYDIIPDFKLSSNDFSTVDVIPEQEIDIDMLKAIQQNEQELEDIEKEKQERLYEQQMQERLEEIEQEEEYFEEELQDDSEPQDDEFNSNIQKGEIKGF